MSQNLYFQSRHLDKGVYDPNSKSLVVSFVNGSVYHYRDVPQDVVDSLSQASSPGSYWSGKKANFTATQVVPPSKKGDKKRRWLK